jgi:hypothetical protein
MPPPFCSTCPRAVNQDARQPTNSAAGPVEALAVFEMTHRGFNELLLSEPPGQDHAQDLQAELERQQVLERATGALMERHGLSADTAAERVRQTAARQGITVSEAAARLLRQPPSEGRHRSGR